MGIRLGHGHINRLIGSIAAAGGALSTAPVAAAQPAGFSTQADAMLQAAYPADGPGAAAIVMRGGRVVYAGGRGLADLEGRRPITPDTVFRLGSITKQFVAAVILQLAAEERISLDDPLSRFFPDWPQPGARATVRQLLNHSSGIQDYTKIPGFMGGEQSLRLNSTPDLLAVIRSRPSAAAPGAAWEYNNGGYVVLGAIIEQVTGKAWHEAVEERIATPLGLTTIGYAPSGSAAAAMAVGYGGGEGAPQPARGVHISVAHAAGALVGSVADMARWAQALHHGRVVSPALYREMIAAARLNDGSTRPYGFGLRLRDLRGRPTLAHGGSGRGLNTDSIYLPAEDLFVAVFANSDTPATDPDTLARRLAAAALGEPFPTLTRAAVDAATLTPLFGAYRAASGPPMRFFERAGRLFFGRGDDEKEAFAAGDDRFFFGPDEVTWFRFVRPAAGTPVLEVHTAEAAAPLRADRTGPPPSERIVAPAVLRSYLGSFATETFTVAIGQGANGGLTLTPAGQEAVPLRALSDTEFRIDGRVPMRVVFHPENGAVNRLTIHRGARQMQGRRVGR